VRNEIKEICLEGCRRVFIGRSPRAHTKRCLGRSGGLTAHTNPMGKRGGVTDNRRGSGTESEVTLLRRQQCTGCHIGAVEQRKFEIAYDFSIRHQHEHYCGDIEERMVRINYELLQLQILFIQDSIQLLDLLSNDLKIVSQLSGH
jgi:hypothetical protein